MTDDATVSATVDEVASEAAADVVLDANKAAAAALTDTDTITDKLTDVKTEDEITIESSEVKDNTIVCDNEDKDKKRSPSRSPAPGSTSGSLIPATGSIGEDQDNVEESLTDAEVDEEAEDEEEEDLSHVVQGTTETLLTRLEKTLAARGDGAPDSETETLEGSRIGPLEEEGKEIDQVLSIISNTIYREGEGQIMTKLCDRSTLLSIVSHSLSAYITALDPIPLQRLSMRIATEVSLWMSSLLHFPDSAAHCHDDIREGLVRTVRLVMHRRYPGLEVDGFVAMVAVGPPVMYITTSSYLEAAEYICLQLALPKSTIKLVTPSENSENFDWLQQIIKTDKENGLVPLICIANVHSSLFINESVTKLQEVCSTEDVWLHLEGHALSATVLLPHDMFKEKRCDSLTLTVGSWIGVPAVPFVTLFRSDAIQAGLAGLGLVTPAVRLSCLPLWCVLKSLGVGHIKKRIRAVYEMLEELTAKLDSLACIRLLSKLSTVETVSIARLEAGQLQPNQIFHTVSPALAFQYITDDQSAQDITERVSPYTDNLNSWLGQILQRDAGHLNIEIVDVETTGYVLRLCPFEDTSMVGLTPDDVKEFLQCFEEKCDILNATVAQRSKFIKIIETNPAVQYINIAHWAGLGGVRFIPQEFIDKETGSIIAEISEDDRKMINERNMELVATLRNSDSAFSLGEGPAPDSYMCVRFGMVTMDTDVEELLSLVISTGKEIDNAVERLQNMSEVVKKGMMQAQDELRQETDNQIWQEGILRHVPLVGSLYNWLSPVPVEAKAKGRYLNLEEGKLESTEKIYKHHMQIRIEDGQDL